MHLFVLVGYDGADGVELRKQHRAAHLDGLQRLARAGRVRYAGPLLDPAGTPRGSVVVFEAEDLEGARAVAAADPYVVEGVFERYEVFETRQVLPAR